MSNHDTIRPLKNSEEEMDSGDTVDPQGSEEGEGRQQSEAQVEEGEDGQRPRADENIGEEEGQPQRGVTSPRLPSSRERAEHELTHCPFRSWCEHSTKGQAKGIPTQEGRRRVCRVERGTPFDGLLLFH